MVNIIARIGIVTFFITLLILGACAENKSRPAVGSTSASTSLYELNGKLLGMESGKPLGGVAIVLGLITGETDSGKRCTLKANLVSMTGEDGNFSFAQVPQGTYAVFYDLSGSTRSDWEEIDETEIYLQVKFPGGVPGGIGSGLPKGYTSTIREGAITYKQGLTMVFYESKPTTVEIKPNETTVIEIKAWGQ